MIQVPVVSFVHVKWGCRSIGRASNRHAVDSGLIPRCGKGIFSKSQILVLTLSCAIACINICVHVKDPVVHVRFRWIMDTLKHPACTVGWVARLRRSWLSRGKATPISHGKNTIWDWHNTVVEGIKKKKKQAQHL